MPTVLLKTLPSPGKHHQRLGENHPEPFSVEKLSFGPLKSNNEQLASLRPKKVSVKNIRGQRYKVELETQAKAKASQIGLEVGLETSKTGSQRISHVLSEEES